MNKKLVLITFIFVVFGIYSNSFQSSFQFNDFITIQANPLVQKYSDINSYFLKPQASYQPLTNAVYAFCWAIGHGATWPFHLYKILAHLFSTWFIFLIAAALLRKSSAKELTGVEPDYIAVGASLLFLVHPALSASVNYLSVTDITQSALFSLGAFWCLLNNARGRWRVALCCVFFALALFSRADALCFPLIASLYFVMFRDPTLSRREFWRKNAPLIGGIVFVVAAYGIIRFVLADQSAPASTAALLIPYFLTRLWASFYELHWIVAPWGFSIEHVKFLLSVTPLDARTIGGGVATILSAAAVYWVSKNQNNKFRLPAFGLGWFVIHYLVDAVTTPTVFAVNEYSYYFGFSMLFPSLIFVLLYAYRGFDFLSLEWNYAGRQRTIILLKHSLKPRVLKVASLVIIVLMAGLTYQRNTSWQSPLRLWSSAIENKSASWFAHSTLGSVYLADGKPESLSKALDEFRTCTRLNPAAKECLVNQHLTLMKAKRFSEAKWPMEELLRIDEKSAAGNWYLANYVLTQEKSPDKALEYVSKCSEKECFDLQAKLLNQLGRVDESVGVLKRMVSSVRLTHEEQFGIANTYIQLKRWSEAETALLEIVQKYPQDEKAAYNLAWVEMQLENWPVAQERWLAAAKLSPDVEGVWSNLKMVVGHTGDTAVSNTCDQELARIKTMPKHEEPKGN